MDSYAIREQELKAEVEEQAQRRSVNLTRRTKPKLGKIIEVLTTNKNQLKKVLRTLTNTKDKMSTRRQVTTDTKKTTSMTPDMLENWEHMYSNWEGVKIQVQQLCFQGSN